MAGINRALGTQKTLAEARKTLGIECVFLSHQQRDKDICKKIADYLIAANIDVYFDEYDADLKVHRQSNNPKGVVDSLRKGIRGSSHMLVVVSPSTISSKWVPWEVGYGYDHIDLSVLTLKGIKDDDLEAYLQTTKIIRGTKSLNSYLATITRSLEPLMESRDIIKSYSAPNHPLDNYLDWNK